MEIMLAVYFLIGCLIYRYSIKTPVFKNAPPFQKLMAWILFVLAWPIIIMGVIYTAYSQAKTRLRSEKMLAEVLRRGKR